MSIDVKLSSGGNEVAVRDNGELRVATDPYLKFATALGVFVNDTFGADMAQSVAFSGTPDGIYNGGDSAWWTASVLSGNANHFVLSSTEEAHSGTRSLKTTNKAGNNSAVLFSRATAITHSNYSAVSGAIFISSWPQTDIKEVALQFRLNGVYIGDPVNIGSYIDTNELSSWQTFVIPLSSFNLDGTPTSDEMSLTLIDVGDGSVPEVFIDDLQIEEIGGSLEYNMAPPVVNTFYVDSIVLTIAATMTGGLTYNKFMSLPELANGINVQVVSGGNTVFQLTGRAIIDFVSINWTVENFMDDGASTLINLKIEYDEPIKLVGSKKLNYLRINISDDLSGLLEFKGMARGRVEI